MYIFYFILLCLSLSANEPISPIPLNTNYNKSKALIGKELFHDTSLSKDHSTSCLSCHNIYRGGADKRVVSLGFEQQKGNIQSPTVFNSKYNFVQFWNGRAKNLLEQADGPLTNPIEHNMDEKLIQDRVNQSKKYKKLFKRTYGVDFITYTLVLDAIVEFEKALITPNAKFDKYLRHEIKLTQNESYGYKLFKHYGCITCHNGINIGSNSFQKFGTFIEYNTKTPYPDRSDITNSPLDKNVFKVPTLRNINLTAPYFHDGNAHTLSEAINKMAIHNLGFDISKKDIHYIEAFLKCLDGEKPKILEK